MAQRTTAIIAAVLMSTAFVHLVPAQTAAPPLDDRLAAMLTGVAPEDIETLITEGEISAPVGENGIRYAPAFAAQIRAENAAIEPTIGIEVLFLMEDAGIPSVTPELLTRMQAVSTMEGIEYYSASRERMRILFIESWAIADPETEERIADPSFSALPERDVLYIRQLDSSFGTNISRLDYTVTDEAIRLRMTNLDRMSYRNVIPAVGPEELQINLVVMPLGDHLLFYGSSVARPVSILGMQDRVQRSFYNRLVALHNWFEDSRREGR